MNETFCLPAQILLGLIDLGDRRLSHRLPITDFNGRLVVITRCRLCVPPSDEISGHAVELNYRTPGVSRRKKLPLTLSGTRKSGGPFFCSLEQTLLPLSVNFRCQRIEDNIYRRLNPFA